MRRNAIRLHAIARLAACLLASPAALHADGPAKARLDSVSFARGMDGYAVYRCPTLAVSAISSFLLSSPPMIEHRACDQVGQRREHQIRFHRGEVLADLNDRFLRCVARAASFLAKHDEPGVLANHHAMAVLPIYEAYDLVKDPKLLRGFHVRLDDFLSHCREEGWCLEYDGAELELRRSDRRRTPLAHRHWISMLFD